MPDQVESEPKRLSCEWHARECEAWAEYTLEADQAATAQGNSTSALLAYEACRDRAQKLRQAERDAAEVRRLRDRVMELDPDAVRCDVCCSVFGMDETEFTVGDDGEPEGNACESCFAALPKWEAPDGE